LALVAAIGLTHLHDPSRAQGRRAAKRSPDEVPAVGPGSELSAAQRTVLSQVSE
jgi:hypothetical protein